MKTRRWFDANSMQHIEQVFAMAAAVNVLSFLDRSPLPVQNCSGRYKPH